MSGNNGFLTAADIFAAPIPTEIVEAFGGKVMVQALLEGRVGAMKLDEMTTEERGYRVMVACVVDPETKQPIFTEADIERMPNLANGEMRKISLAIQRVNGWTVETITKNSQTQVDDSATDSPVILG